MTNEIQVIPENDIQVAFKKFDATEIFGRLSAEAKSVVFDLSDPKQHAALRSHVAKIRKSKAAFESFGSDLKKQYAEIPKKIDETRKYFKESCDDLIEELLAPLVQIEMAEKKRKDDIQAKINLISLDMDHVENNKTSSLELKELLTKIKAIKITSDEFNEFETQAKIVRMDAIESLESMIPEAESLEAKEAEELKIINAEIEADRIKQEEIEKQRQIERDEQIKRQATIDAENAVKAKQDELLRQKEEAERKAQEAQKKADLAIEREKQRVAEEQRQLAEAESKRQANKAHQKRTCEKALDDLKSIVMADTTGLTLGEMMKDSDLKKIINAIHKGEVSNISINY